ncbi:MAG: hypothetical protein ACRDGH_12385 [Candidatus Limnocylindria bacterium]
MTYCGDDGRRPKGLDLPPSPIQDTETADDVWILIVTQAGMGIITRDKKLLTRPGELGAIAASRARVFTILVEDDPSNPRRARIIVATRYRGHGESAISMSPSKVPTPNVTRGEHDPGHEPGYEHEPEPHHEPGHQRGHNDHRDGVGQTLPYEPSWTVDGSWRRSETEYETDRGEHEFGGAVVLALPGEMMRQRGQPARVAAPQGEPERRVDENQRWPP